MKSSFSIKFNTLRKDRKLSIKEVALMTGVSPREVKKWENGSLRGTSRRRDKKRVFNN